MVNEGSEPGLGISGVNSSLGEQDERVETGKESRERPAAIEVLKKSVRVWMFKILQPKINFTIHVLFKI